MKQENGEILVSRPTNRGEHRALHGLTRSLIANMVEGVTSGFEKRLEIQGVGYRAQLQGSKLVLALGYSHPVEMDAPTGIDFEVLQPTRIVRGISKQASARWLPTSASSARRSPTRARASATRASTSLEGREARMTSRRSRVAAAPPPARARQDQRHGGPAAAVGFRCNRGIQAQLIDDPERPHAGRRHWTEGDLKSLGSMEQAKRAGEMLAERAKAAGHGEPCLRPRWLPLPRQGEGARRGRAGGGA